MRSLTWILGFGVRIQALLMDTPKQSIIIRRILLEKPSLQLFLPNGELYLQVIITDFFLKSINLWRFYNYWTIGELTIRKLLEAYNLGKIPSREWASNQAYLNLVLVTNDLVNWFKRLRHLPDWQQPNLQTIRNRLFSSLGQLIRPQGRLASSLLNIYLYLKPFLQFLWNINKISLEKLLMRENYNTKMQLTIKKSDRIHVIKTFQSILAKSKPLIKYRFKKVKKNFADVI